MRDALRAAWVSVNPQVLSNLVHCIKDGPIWFKQIFITFPAGNPAVKSFQQSYHDFAHGYNLWWFAVAWYRDIWEEQKLPKDFMTLATSLWYQWENPKHAWLYVFDLIAKDESLSDVAASQKYVTYVLRKDIVWRANTVLSSSEISVTQKKELIKALEKLNEAIGGHFEGYDKNASIEKRIESLMQRLHNRLWAYNNPAYNHKNRPYEEQRGAINAIEWLLKKRVQ